MQLKNFGLYAIHIVQNVRIIEMPRITQVEEVYEKGGRNIVLTVGNTIPETVDWNAD